MNNPSSAHPASLQDASGPLAYNMTNDYMFRAVLQTSNKVLTGLVCSLLHLDQSEVSSAVITNPVILGESIADKEFRLDISVTLNTRTLINLEMQVANRLNWPERSVSYLCRSYDQLNHGEEYSEVKPVIHIAFLDYTLFKNYPEFYATYRLQNVKNHHLYSDKLTLSVVDLTRIDLAADEDKRYRLDYWAFLFKAATWEEIKMLAAKNPYINEASNTIFQLSANEQIQKRCRDREEYYLDIRSYERCIAQKDAEIASLASEIAQLKTQLEQYQTKDSATN